MDVEPIRAVPVRMRAGHRSRTLAITGLPSTPRLNRVVDREGGPKPLRRVWLNLRMLSVFIAIAALLGIAVWPQPAVVEVAIATRGPLVVTVDEEGVTRVRDRFVVSSPVAGRVLRIELDPGDAVRRGQPVALVRAEVPSLLDERSRAEAEAAVESAKAALGRARAEEQRARVAAAQLQRELARVRGLAEDRVVSAQELDAHEAESRAGEESVNAATFAVQAATSELQRAQARLTTPNTQTRGRVVTVPSPADGVVLRRIRESESMVPAGEPLLEIGDPMRLEIVSDLLSTDAVRVKPASRALIEQWGGDATLHATVRRVEPSGFTKISALGVEEQRVNVILDFNDPSAACAALGDAYRVEVRIVVWESEDGVKVPTSALFRDAQQWAVYRIVGNRAERTRVEVGHQTGQEAEIAAGVSAGDRVIVHPGDALKHGARVRSRQNSMVQQT
jgi:HlyD family secretion protein